MSTARNEFEFEEELERQLARPRPKSGAADSKGEAPLALGIDFASLRRALHLTQQDVAVLLGVSRVTYIKYETDPDTMPIGTYKKLIRELRRLSELRRAA